ncbi:putative 4-alpha-glucanotransferase [Microstroma glucosiphilum]|uniref:Glycogen debranching enzyme n=1 Tax=Pseudomicrostroma glucosiphilum TaxID=1684307 RepID=A0A316UG66_9BASI|nr:putative 4-alpha-glucanotransferase [Pseudomicrostroma glucosiphilum]PWN22903.1 putative 4-alpha-glucanotransferase [Pseudomicrostroma glucosiphilum]
MSQAGPIQVYQLSLEDDGSPSKEKSYIRLPAPVEPYLLRFGIEAGSVASKQGSLWTNFPPQGQAFERSKFTEYKLPGDVSKATHVDLYISQPGAFEFYVEHAAPDDEITYPTVERPVTKPDPSKRKRVQSRHGSFNVDPIITIPERTSILDQKSLKPATGGGKVGTKDVVISQTALVTLSFFAKWAGPLSEWAPHLKVASEAGYNMIHYTPLQVRGSSNSPYSIADQLDFAHDMFDAKAGRSSSREERAATLKSWLQKIRKEYGMLSLMDVVLNHTANSSEWLNEHPEAGYTPENSPHLTPAEELDRALYEFSNNLASLGLPTDPKSAADVDKIIEGVKAHVLDPLKLWQYYVIDVKATKEAVSAAWSSSASKTGTPVKTSEELATALKAQALRGELALSDRFVTHLDTEATVAILKSSYSDESSAVEAVGKAVDALNVPLYQTYDDDIKAITSNLKGRLAYMRVEEGGPKLGPITPESPFCETYFTRLDPNHPSVKKAGHSAKSLALANNGWIWAADPLMDFASSKSRVYLRREVIAWADCVKLRYGSGPQDSPYLWKHMEQYVTASAEMCDAFRIDNCHSTPVHVGEYFLDVARRVKPNLYVCAELFTGSEEMDVYFVSRLGLNALIREMENGHDPKEESRLLYRFGVNKPIGSMDKDCLSTNGVAQVPGKGSEIPAVVTPLSGSSPDALFMDVTHDNETPTKKRTTEDIITMGSLVAFSWSAIGSTKGVDELYPELLNVVDETRKYEVYSAPADRGIGEVKRIVNSLHREMVQDGYEEGHVHQEGDYIMFHRVHPKTHKGYLCIAHTAFHKDGPKGRGQITPIHLDRTKVQYIAGKTLEVTNKTAPQDKETLKGLESKLIDVPAPSVKEGRGDNGVFYSEIVIPENFPPGSIMLFASAMEGLSTDLEALCKSGAKEAFADLDLVDLNVILYRADGEEKDSTQGKDGVYAIPNDETHVYCGLEGWMHSLRKVMRHNDLGHPLCAHLRNGCWALDYVHGRLEKQTGQFPRVAKPAAWMKERFDKIAATVPSFMRPKYFALTVSTAYEAAVEQAVAQMSPFVREGHPFIRSLALCSVQMNGNVKSASLWHDRPSASMAAGLPFFAASWARLWGRDVFISLRGLYLTTAMHQYAREHIHSFGCTLKHGLIPNLLNSTTNPRYNCRDGPWFFAQNVQDYTKMVPNGLSILDDKIKRRFPLDDEWVPVDSPKAFAYESTVAELIQEILQRHASGIHFREHDAGTKIDEHMKDKGFNIDIETDWSTGIIFGGNESNCGTWQDKNGSSIKAGNRGVPGSPRDGAAIEITALLKSTLTWVANLQAKGKWPLKATGVEATVDGKKRTVTYKEWADLIQKSFERCYWVPLNASDDSKYRLDSKLVNRRGIYKDVFGSGKGREWSDYQFRSNFPIAMCVAPELFDREHAQTALQAAHSVLRGPLGMRTLDPSDSNYRGDYDNSNDTTDFHLAQGWNYHNGPEWVFPTGFFLRAKVLFSEKDDETWHHISALLLEHRRHVKESPWAGLPELTNSNGSYCRDSCATQAWSASTILDALFEMWEARGGAK